MPELEWAAVQHQDFVCGVAMANDQIIALVVTPNQSGILTALQSRISDLRRKWPELGDLPLLPANNSVVTQAALLAIDSYCKNPECGDRAFSDLISDDYIQQVATATPFEKCVWLAMRDIPTGQTISYAQLANNIGRPTAVRAVASACGKNPWAIAVPCHRIIRSDASLGGYHWGLDVKQHLLNHEAQWLTAQGGPSIRGRTRKNSQESSRKSPRESLWHLPCQRQLEFSGD